MKKLFALAVIGVVLLMSVPASAHTGSAKRLRFFSDDTGDILWQRPRLDSPLDSNTSRLMAHVLFQTGDDFAGAFALGTGIEGQAIGNVKNLSFDFMNVTGNPVHIGAGSPRYSVELDTDNDTLTDLVAFLAAFHCPAVLPEDTRWSRADFTGRTQAGCSIFVGAETFTSDGTTSAWGLMSAAHPTWTVVQAYLVVDEEGTVFLDRLAFQNHMFVTSGSGSGAIKHCSSESSC